MILFIKAQTAFLALLPKYESSRQILWKWNSIISRHFKTKLILVQLTTVLGDYVMYKIYWRSKIYLSCSLPFALSSDLAIIFVEKKWPAFLQIILKVSLGIYSNLTRHMLPILKIAMWTSINSKKSLMSKPVYLTSFLWVHFRIVPHRLQIMQQKPPGVFWNPVLLNEQNARLRLVKKDSEIKWIF